MYTGPYAIINLFITVNNSSVSAGKSSSVHFTHILIVFVSFQAPYNIFQPVYINIFQITAVTFLNSKI